MKSDSMKNNLASAREWGVRNFLSIFLKKYDIFDMVKLEVNNFRADGLILDIGGGGEGVIGRLKGSQVVAMDLCKDELDGTVNGAAKVVMDARHLALPDHSFTTSTAFFSMMFLKTKDDQQRVLEQIWRVLRPAGRLLIWDADLSERSTNKGFYFVRLRYRVGNFEKETGYGAKFPAETRDEAYYIQLARQVGFHHLTTEKVKHVFFLDFVKPE